MIVEVQVGVFVMIFPFAGIPALFHRKICAQCVESTAVFTAAKDINARDAGFSEKVGSRTRGSLECLGDLVPGRQSMRK